MPSASSSTRRSRPLLGTFVEIVVPGDPGPGVEAAIDQAFGEVASIHALMSFHERASDVSRLNRGAGDGFIEISPATAEVMAAALELNRVSGGAFDVTIAPHLQRRGLLPACGARRSDPGTMAAGSACPPDRDARAGCDPIELTADGRARLADPQTRIDLGGIAKGYAVDRAIQSLRAHGIASALVNAGGDIAATGETSFEVQLRDPRAPSGMLAAFELRNGAMASSGGAFDPFTGRDVAEPACIDAGTGAPSPRLGATVWASSCMLADALTKVVMLRGLDALTVLAHYDAAALVVEHDGTINATSNCPRPHAP